MKSAFDIKFVFNKWTLGEDFLTGAPGRAPAEKADGTRPSTLLLHLGFSKKDAGRPPTSTSCGA